MKNTYIYTHVYIVYTPGIFLTHLRRPLAHFTVGNNIYMNNEQLQNVHTKTYCVHTRNRSGAAKTSVGLLYCKGTIYTCITNNTNWCIYTYCVHTRNLSDAPTASVGPLYCEGTTVRGVVPACYESCDRCVLQCDTVCCSVMPCVAVCCSAFEGLFRHVTSRAIGVFCRVLQSVAVCCSVRCSVRCSVLQFALQYFEVCVAVCCSVLQCVAQ